MKEVMLSMMMMRDDVSAKFQKHAKYYIKGYTSYGTLRTQYRRLVETGVERV